MQYDVKPHIKAQWPNCPVQKRGVKNINLCYKINLQ